MKSEKLPQVRPYSLGELAEVLAMRPLALHNVLEPYKNEIGEPEDFSFGKLRYSIRQVKIIFGKLF